MVESEDGGKGPRRNTGALEKQQSKPDNAVKSTDTTIINKEGSSQ